MLCIAGYIAMLKSIEKIVEEQIKLERLIIEILDDAAYAEKFIAGPHNNRCPSMYQVLESYYDKKDWGFHVKPKLVLRATPRQMSRYELALDILLFVDDDISDNPKLDRKLLWLRANRFKWTKLGKFFGFHRITIKNRYKNLLDKLSNKLKNNFDKLDKVFI